MREKQWHNSLLIGISNGVGNTRPDLGEIVLSTSTGHSLRAAAEGLHAGSTAHTNTFHLVDCCEVY